MPLKPPSADLSDLVRILRFSGQYFAFDGRWSIYLEKLQYVRVAYLAFSAMMGYLSIYLGGLKETMGIELTYTILGTMTMCQQFHMIRYHKDVEAVVQMIRSIRKRFQKDTDEEFQARTRNVYLGVYCYYAFFTLTSIIMIIPVLVDLLIWSWETPFAYRLPMALGSLLDGEQRRNVKYFAVTVQANGWMLCSGYTHMGIDALLFISCYSYSSMVQTFCQGLKLDPKLDSKQRTAYIKMVAAHQQALQTLTHKVQLLIGFPYFFQNLIGAFVICSMLFVMESKDSEDLIKLLSNGANLMIVLQLMGLTAFAGQKFTDQSSLIFNALYDFPWYELSPSDRKYFLLMVGAARKPFTINFHGAMPLNAENFMAICNTAYSYLTFLKS